MNCKRKKFKLNFPNHYIKYKIVSHKFIKLKSPKSSNLEQHQSRTKPYSKPFNLLKAKICKEKYYQGKKLVRFSNHICNQVTVYHQNIFHSGKNVTGCEPCL